jgi:hypothetical protein
MRSGPVTSRSVLLFIAITAVAVGLFAALLLLGADGALASKVVLVVLLITLAVLFERSRST